MGRKGRYARGIFCTGEIEIKMGETMGGKACLGKKKFYVHFLCKTGQQDHLGFGLFGWRGFFSLIKDSIPNLNL